MYLIQKIEETAIQYNDSKKVIATFLIENAEETYTSKASLVVSQKR